MKMFHIFSAALIIFFSASTYAVVVQHSPGVSFKVIQDELVFDKNSVVSANLVSPRSPVDHFYTVDVQLSEQASNKMKEISQKGIGKQAMIIANGYVISAATIRSALGGRFQITGLSKPQAQQLIQGFK